MTPLITPHLLRSLPTWTHPLRCDLAYPPTTLQAVVTPSTPDSTLNIPVGTDALGQPIDPILNPAIPTTDAPLLSALNYIARDLPCRRYQPSSSEITNPALAYTDRSMLFSVPGNFLHVTSSAILIVRNPSQPGTEQYDVISVRVDVTGSMTIFHCSKVEH